MKWQPFALVAWLIAVSLTSAQLPPPPPPSATPKPAATTDEKPEKARVRIECHMVILSQADLLPLLPQLRDPAGVEKAWSIVQEMVTKGTATLAGDLLAHGTLGQRLTAESAEEFRYATEWEPPQLPSDVSSEKSVELLKAWPHVGVTPTSFETRNVGQSVEVETTRSGDLLKVNLALQHTRFLRWNQFDAGRLADGEHLKIDQPVFHTMKNQTVVWLKSGEHILLGLHRSPADGPPAFEIFMLSATLLDPPK